MTKLCGEDTSPGQRWEIMESPLLPSLLLSSCPSSPLGNLGGLILAMLRPEGVGAGRLCAARATSPPPYSQACLASFLLPPKLCCPVPAQLCSRWMRDGDHHVCGGTLSCPHGAWGAESPGTVPAAV